MNLTTDLTSEKPLKNPTNISMPFLSQLTDFGLLKISGNDRFKFLQGQITTNIESLSANQLSLSAICNPKGRCISLFFVCQTETEVYLIMKQSCIEDSIVNLKKYAVFYQVEIEDCSALYRLDATTGQITKSDLQDDTFYQASWQEKDLSIIISEKIQNAAPSIAGYQIASQQDWLYVMAMRGIPWLDQPTQTEFLPHNLNLPQLAAVDFKKGCFTGQEVIARMQYKGKLKTHMQLFHLAEPVGSHPMQDILCEGETAAQIICYATSSAQNTAILALLKDSYLKGKIFRLDKENGPILELIEATN